MALSKNGRAALIYANEFRLAVIPLHSMMDGVCSCKNPNCHSPGKHPRTENGLHEASLDEQQITKWWHTWPNANIGVATGSVSGIFVIDIDGEDGEDTFSLLEDELGSLPETWISLTGGGGRHIVFKHPGNVQIKNRVNLAPAVDIRGDGGYIVVPPSNHSSGKDYAWEISSHPRDISLSECPESWMRMILSGPGITNTPVELPDVFPQGSRNALMFSLACSLRARGLSETAILAALVSENQLRCKPPLDDREIRNIAGSAGKYDQGEVVPMELPTDKDGLFQSIKLKAASYIPGTSVPDDLMEAMAEMQLMSPVDYKILLTNEIKPRTGMSVSAVEQDTKQRLKKRDKAPRLTAVQESDEPYAHNLIKSFPFPDYNIRIPNGFLWDQRGIFLRKDDLVRIPVSGTPAVITRILKNIDSEEQKVELVFRSSGKRGFWHSMIVPRSTVFTTKNIVSLTDRGLSVTSETAKMLVSFLDKQLQDNPEIPQTETISRFGWVTDDFKAFVPYASDAFEEDFSDVGGDHLMKGYRIKGSLESWVLRVGNVCKSYPMVRAQLAAGFASPLMALINQRVFLVHVWGPSGGGKTAGGFAAMSIWGDPESLKVSFNATRVGLEQTAALYTDLPMLIDERQAAAGGKSGSDYVKTLVYMLGLGKTKARGIRGGGLQKAKTWRTVAITTGEHPITDVNIEEGVKNRMLELYGKPFQDDQSVAAGLYNATADCHGSAGQRFIQGLIALITKTPDYCISLHDRFVKELAVVEERGISHMTMTATLCLADMLSGLLIYGLPEEIAFQDSLEFGMVLLEDYVQSKSGDGIMGGTDSERALEYLASVTQTNQAFFGIEGHNGITWGFGLGNDSEYLNIYPTAFNKIMKEGEFNPQRILRDWAEEGIIKVQRMKNKVQYSYPVRPPGGDRNERIRVILISKSVLFPKSEATNDGTPF